MIRLPNGNVIKFSYTNRKHFAVGDLMAFSIVNMGKKNPPKPPLPHARYGPYLIQQCIRPTARTTPNGSSDGWGTVAHVRREVAIGYNGAPQIRPQKYPFHLWARPNYDAKRHLDPIRRFSTMHWTDRPTDRPTDRSQKSLLTIARSASNDSDAA